MFDKLSDLLDYRIFHGFWTNVPSSKFKPDKGNNIELSHDQHKESESQTSESQNESHEKICKIKFSTGSIKNFIKRLLGSERSILPADKRVGKFLEDLIEEFFQLAPDIHPGYAIKYLQLVPSNRKVYLFINHKKITVVSNFKKIRIC